MSKQFNVGDHVDWPPRGYVGQIMALRGDVATLSSPFYMSAPIIELIPTLSSRSKDALNVRREP